MNKTKKEIIEETAAFYNISNRGVDGNHSTNSITDSCLYENDQGHRCAVGRCMTEEFISILKENTKKGDNSKGLILSETVLSFSTEEGSIDHALKSEYHGHDVEFWETLQTFHDRRENWDENGLTEQGKYGKEKLLQHYSRSY